MTIVDAVVTVAGKGSRLSDLSFTRILPKPLLPILDKPIVHFIVENLKNIGIRRIVLSVRNRRELFEEYFGDGRDYGVEIDYVESRPLAGLDGIAVSITAAKDAISSPFMVVLGDDFTVTPSLANLRDTFLEKNALVVEGVVQEPDLARLSRACSAYVAPDGRLTDLVEKEIHPRAAFRGCGIYVFDPIVFDYIARTKPSPLRGEVEITDTIRLIISEHPHRVFGTLINGVNININTLEDLIQANMLALMDAVSHHSFTLKGEL